MRELVGMIAKLKVGWDTIVVGYKLGVAAQMRARYEMRSITTSHSLICDNFALIYDNFALTDM